MNRHQLIQSIADRIDASCYLEIGVQSGDTFFPLRISKKIGVDPRFEITRLAKLNWIRWNWRNAFNEYHRMTSDEFFRAAGALLGGRRLDLVLVDGLHVYDQALRDILNALRHLEDHGVILVDDCNPGSAGAASPVKARDQHIWNGDVWKAIALLRATRTDLRIFTLDCIHGMGVITRGAAEAPLDVPPETIGHMTYEDFDRARTSILNLRPVSELDRLLASLTGPAARQRAAQAR